MKLTYVYQETTGAALAAEPTTEAAEPAAEEAKPVSSPNLSQSWVLLIGVVGRG
jgi:hypothetical protein